MFSILGNAVHLRSARLASLGPSRSVLWLLTAAAAAVVLALTLTPVQGGQTGLWRKCFVCGERGVADMVDNVILFTPFATGLLLVGKRWWATIGLSAALSLFIEITQVIVPGRDPSPVDVLFNTFGAVAAAGIILLASASIESERRRSARTSVIAAGLFALVVAATGVLLSPSLPSSTYYGQWTPELGRLERYGGSVVSATVGQDSIPPHPFPIEVLRDRFLSGVPLVVKAVAGPPPPGLAPIVSVYDELQRRILFVGADGDDLVFHLRTRAGSLALDEAGQRVSGALGGVISGEPVVITVQRQPAGQCVSVDGVESCAQVEASDGWVALYSLEGSPAGFRRLVGMIWMAMLAVPVGAFLRPRSEALVSVGLMAMALVVLPNLVGLGPTAPRSYAAMAIGLAAGAVLAAALRRRNENRGQRETGTASSRGWKQAAEGGSREV